MKMSIALLNLKHMQQRCLIDCTRIKQLCWSMEADMLEKAVEELNNEDHCNTFWNI